MDQAISSAADAAASASASASASAAESTVTPVVNYVISIPNLASGEAQIRSYELTKQQASLSVVLAAAQRIHMTKTRALDSVDNVMRYLQMCDGQEFTYNQAREATKEAGIDAHAPISNYVKDPCALELIASIQATESKRSVFDRLTTSQISDTITAASELGVGQLVDAIVFTVARAHKRHAMNVQAKMTSLQRQRDQEKETDVYLV